MGGCLRRGGMGVCWLARRHGGVLAAPRHPPRHATPLCAHRSPPREAGSQRSSANSAAGRPRSCRRSSRPTPAPPRRAPSCCMTAANPAGKVRRAVLSPMLLHGTLSAPACAVHPTCRTHAR
eukprot:1411290-Prymnesium_polylepis.1